jgi:hypothetical protein
MKKYLMIFAAVSALFMTACKPQPQPEKEVTFEITISDLTASEANMAVKPSDNNVFYYFDILASSYMSEYESQEALAADYIEYLIDLADYYTEAGEPTDWIEFLSQGEDSWKFEGLTAETEYIGIAFAIDTAKKELKGKVATKSFTTAEVQKTVLTFQIAMSDTAVWFLPNKQDITYLSLYSEPDSITAYGYTPEDYFHAYMEYMAEMYAYYGYTLDDMVMYGDIYIPVQDGEEVYLEQGHNYLFMAQAYTSGVYNSDFFSAPFTAPVPSNAAANTSKGQFNKQMRLKKAKKIENINKDARAKMAK